MPGGGIPHEAGLARFLTLAPRHRMFSAPITSATLVPHQAMELWCGPVAGVDVSAGWAGLARVLGWYSHEKLVLQLLADDRWDRSTD